jgi:hypothetical protein
MTFVVHHTAAAERLRAEVHREAPHNNEMQRTKPAQAIELRR